MMDGQLIQAAYVMFNAEVGGWSIGVLFLVYQFMLWMKTKNLTACVITTMMFVALFFSSTLLPRYSMVIITVTLVFELAGILYLWIFE